METGHSVVELGDKIHIITRRNFPDDLRRHFAGTVRVVTANAMRLQGFTFVFNPTALEYRKRPEVRTRLFGFSDAQLIINVLPHDTNMDGLHYANRDGRLVVTDGSRFSLDVNEFGATM